MLTLNSLFFPSALAQNPYNWSKVVERSAPEPRRRRKDSSAFYRSQLRKELKLKLTPRNLKIVKYCRELIHVRFHGANSKQTKVDEAVTPQLLVKAFGRQSLGKAIQEVDLWLRKRHWQDLVDDPSTDSASQELWIRLWRARCGPQLGEGSTRQKFMEDVKRFVAIYKERGRRMGNNGHSQAMQHEEYWGGQQQMLSGKVISDFIDPTYGPLDPVFGILLNPTTGRWGPGDSGALHYMFHKDDRAEAYHTAVHDAFGYLITEHGIGPGYNYLGVKEMLSNDNPYAGQVAGFYFWLKVMKAAKRRSKRTILI